MSIIYRSYLKDQLPESTFNNEAADEAISYATSFVNTYTSLNYYPWEDYQASPLTPLAPMEIVSICTEIAKAKYFLITNEEDADGSRKEESYSILDIKMNELKKINVNPTYKTQTISLDSTNSQIIGSFNSGSSMYPDVIPWKIFIRDGASVWNLHTDYSITKGGYYNNEYENAWYLRANTASLDGTLHYMRTYRSDGFDNLAQRPGC